ncbi:hypothetical protein IFT67_10590 [Sphingomonas sp. CFBP 13728]|uniref:hypothetical protein n=1 Tax=Sphingomonas sp. CFBP 13728 TaxID=2775294 RepID=UPI001781C4B0|nr:hypothetical protein [Sphingomonas sp. CFBP 13728]MBD8619367.1 hypothetical protein [Sphingomonas sp. CFBP 13728]
MLDAIRHRCSRRLTLGDVVGPSDGWRSELIRRASILRHSGRRGLIRYLRPVLDVPAGLGEARRLGNGRYAA